MSERDRITQKAANMMTTAIFLPVGAGVYLLGGWTWVAIESVGLVLFALGMICWGAWQEVKRDL